MTEEVIFRVPEAREADMDRAVAAARQAFDKGPWPKLTHAERAAYLSRLGAGLKARGEELGHVWTNQIHRLRRLQAFGRGTRRRPGRAVSLPRAKDPAAGRRAPRIGRSWGGERTAKSGSCRPKPQAPRPLRLRAGAGVLGLRDAPRAGRYQAQRAARVAAVGELCSAATRS